MMTHEEFMAKQEAEIQAKVSSTPLVILEFYERITMPADELYSEYDVAVRCEAVMTSWNEGNVFRWSVANLQVFDGEHRVALYAATPMITMHGATQMAQLPFEMDVMYRLIAKAEQLFPKEITNLLHPPR